MTAPRSPDPRLYNEDLAPAKERTWGTYSIFALWMSDTHAISNYAFAASLFVLGLPTWEVFLSLLAGITIVHWLMNRMGHAGHRTGVPFPVLARASWGVYGANIPALLRAVMAVAWYGIQTWLASEALILLGVQLAPGLAEYDHNSILGLSTLGWIAFLVMWLLQAVLLTRGMEFIRKVQDFATGPVVWLVMLVLAVWLVVKAGGDISLTRSLTGLSGGEQLHQSVIAVSLTVATFLTLVLNYADFARFTPDHRSYRRGNLLGLPVNFTAFAVVSVLMTAGTISVFGTAVADPVHVIARIDNPVVTVVGALSFMIATIGINVVANFVSPAYDFANLAPKHLDFRRGGMVTAVLAIVVMPWKLYSSPVVIQYFLGGLGAFLGPLVAILLVDYYLVRRGRIDVDALFSADQAGAYYYRRGFNPEAVIAFVPAAAVSAVLALVKFFSDVAPFSWCFGLAIAGGVYGLRSAKARVGGAMAQTLITSQVTTGGVLARPAAE
ncbi:NCS1 family nucleobase:cation symporter-1 [Streptomyces rapamycinicus]|uniref:Nitrate reductase n=2 Tax=Streptomyces rapamycinicus TaxID=1226757 RepID=A0A0A0NAK8_STRRN|nr:NCS1 family nucleobase:cation symporter-1 [Streptomyces rapamycinicus]AGP54311.1 nitrate reductase [Streptomyces rapamycinicus NRRL 5491]MBB4781814.1 NCS1 family nucleobase:cation symporter-1 [Streptomyces rapamycinicus]RLV73543.1 nitrate reductase [Streptomyces rapamycinicus NRRL 5491]UTO62381.1 NCS1 family nucleobase:cation symporter-1 [Streptomyces rapamycinicus]UTP30337.1 NCS1 family nucleobase:cation symporter-1 [Streptomyces rapamycinicus NRRL 5491]